LVLATIWYALDMDLDLAFATSGKLNLQSRQNGHQLNNILSSREHSRNYRFVLEVRLDP